ncbi:hypothetical protein FKM82_001574 [Ascaphus truei]
MRPQVLAQRVWDYCWCWLKPETRSSIEVAELLALEQFFRVLPLGGRERVCRNSTKTLHEASRLMENFKVVVYRTEHSPMTFKLEKD